MKNRYITKKDLDGEWHVIDRDKGLTVRHYCDARWIARLVCRELNRRKSIERTTVYHWTTIKALPGILLHGLREESFVCDSPDSWDGEVCLSIELEDFTWDGRGESYSWQAPLHRAIEPHQISVVCAVGY